MKGISMNCPVCKHEVNQEIEPTWISYDGTHVLHLVCADQLVGEVISIASHPASTEFTQAVAQAIFRRTREAMGIDA